MSSRSFTVGNYTRHIQSEEDPFDTRVRAFRNDTVDSLPNKFENWDKEHVREAIEGMGRQDQRQQTITARVSNAETWLTEHPEFVRNNANIDLMNHELTRTFGEIEWTLAHYDHAYQSLRASNFLKLDAREVKKQEQAAARQRAAG